MSIRFSPAAALCTAVIVGGFAALLAAQLPQGLYGLDPLARDGLLPIGTGGEAREDVQRDIIAAVLIHEARRPGRDNVCLRLAEEGRTFEAEKRSIRALERQVREEPSQRERLVRELARLRAPARTWLQPLRDGAESVPILSEGARQLSIAETSLLGASEAGRLDFALDGSVVPPSFRSNDPQCSIVAFTAPAMAGDVAFVEASHRCGAGCGDDRLYAVANRDGRWSVAAMARLDPP